MADTDEQRGGEAYVYDAFISYRHVERDRKWAEWLIEALETYRVPKSLQARGLPPRLRKVFRDEDEVPASGDLNDQIKQALKSSRFLIVVCSAFTPRSRWVEREIEMFNEFGRGDNVLALLTEGEPGDSFPAPMLVRRREVTDPDGSKRIIEEAKEPLAADVRPRSNMSMERLKRLALLRLIAVILGVKFDDLRQREHERERRKVLTWATATAALALLVAGSGAFYWQTTRQKVAYYRQLVWRWGAPEGLGPLDEAIRGRLESSFKVVSKGGKVLEVRRENSSGSLREADPYRQEETGQAHWLVTYRPDGGVATIDIFDGTERLVREEHYDRGSAPNKMVVDFKRDTVDLAQTATSSLAIDPSNTDTTNTADSTARTDITRHEVTFDGNGFLVEFRYQNHYGSQQFDIDGSYGRRIIYSPDGQPLRRSEIDQDGKEITLKNGVRAVTFAYGASYRLMRLTLIGADDKPVIGPAGYAYVDFEYDDAGNLTRATSNGPDGKPVLYKDGFADVRLRYDLKGNKQEAQTFGLDGKPTLI